MKQCPRCGQPRQGDTYKCPSCDVFYSQLDQILFEDQERQEASTFKGALKRIRKAENRSQAATLEIKTLWRNTPLKTKIVLWSILAFIFVLVVPIF